MMEKEDIYYGVEKEDSLLNHPALLRLRKMARAGQTPKECSICTRIEKLGGVSVRMRHNQTKPVSEIREYGTVLSSELLHLDVRLGNRCNFMCVMCNPFSSHLIAKENNAYPNKFQTETDTSHLDWPDHLYEKLEETLDQAENLQQMHIAGGEPFLMKARMLKMLEKVGHRRKQIEMQITSNGSLYDPDIIEALKGFKSVTLALSIDATGKYIEFSRWNANWNVLQENVKKFASHSHIRLILLSTISCLTLPDLPNLLKWLGSHEDHLNFVGFNLLQNPSHLGSHMVRPEIVARAEEAVKNFKSKTVPKKEKNKLLSALEELPQKRPSKIEIENLNQHFLQIKRARGFDVWQSFPELANGLQLEIPTEGPCHQPKT